MKYSRNGKVVTMEFEEKEFDFFKFLALADVESEDPRSAMEMFDRYMQHLMETSFKELEAISDECTHEDKKSIFAVIDGGKKE